MRYNEDMEIDFGNKIVKIARKSSHISEEKRARMQKLGKRDKKQQKWSCKNHIQNIHELVG